VEGAENIQVLETMPIRITYDAKADAAYIYLADVIEPGAAVRQAVTEPLGLILDFDVQDKLLGIEVLKASRVLREDTLSEAEQIG
jgi:uncharacterized protein YuzE